MDKQFPDNCLAFGGITTGIQRLRHMVIFRISIGLSFGTSNPDTWRLKLSTRCQLLVDHSELCTNVIFNFSQLILEASAVKKNGTVIGQPRRRCGKYHRATETPSRIPASGRERLSAVAQREKRHIQELASCRFRQNW